ncbi:MAG: tetratricopeptide repeat protein [Candidatus Obscuribacterales bacterium]|nr:tetratricopeptide repeat protein [Candidatus Obscuribacterales bacterium]
MVFQPTTSINRRLSVLVAVGTLAFCQPCFADGFPGRGNPHDWSAALPYYNLANKYMQQERYEDAIQKYHEAIGRYEYDPDFFNNLGVALRKIENFEAAEQAFKSAAALNAKDWMSWSNLANSYLKQDRLEETIKAFEQSLKCNPPPQEKEAILKDIADIKKIIGVRSGNVQPPASKTPPARIIKEGKQARGAPGAKSTGELKPIGTARPATPRQNQELKGTGWEEVAK